MKLFNGAASVQISSNNHFFLYKTPRIELHLRKIQSDTAREYGVGGGEMID